MTLRLLDLFSGTHSVGKIASQLGFEVTSLDLHDASFNTDILEWDYKQLPVGHFDTIWCSPPCDSFSCMKRINIGRNGYTRESVEKDMLERGVPILRRAEEIIDYFQPAFWFIENPQTGKMKEFIAHRPFYDVDYCKYCDWGYRKRTRIWTNKRDFVPRVCRKDCGYVVGNRHIMEATSTQGGGSNRAPRYRVPPQLVCELLAAL